MYFAGFSDKAEVIDTLSTSRQILDTKKSEVYSQVFAREVRGVCVGRGRDSERGCTAKKVIVILVCPKAIQFMIQPSLEIGKSINEKTSKPEELFIRVVKGKSENIVLC